MKNTKSILCVLFVLFVCVSHGFSQQTFAIVCDEQNDLYQLLIRNNIKADRFDCAEEAITRATNNTGVIITASGYPDIPVTIDSELLKAASGKKLRLYVEYVNAYPGVRIDPVVYRGSLERAVISSSFFKPALKEMDLLALNDCHLFKAEVKSPLVSYARVAGFDQAQYGLTDTDVYPLLFRDKNNLVALSCLSNFRTARYSPNDNWKKVWLTILQWVAKDNTLSILDWTSDPEPFYAREEILPVNARRQSVRKGTEWLYKGRFFVHPSWKEHYLAYQGDGTEPFGPPLGSDKLCGDGSLGILEGHASTIYYDGSEQYRYWLRNDVQGEVSFLLASASSLLQDKKYAISSEKLLDYMFYESVFRKGPRAVKDSASYGLLGWSYTHPYVFYNDDNARALLGAIGASAYLQTDRWNQYIVECILANLRTCSRQGFQGGRIEEPNVLRNGWQYYYNRDYTNPHPHFESWMWACYLWLYDKTGYKPLLEKAKTAIRITMEAYPDNWNWTNGIQQERARMVLPLAWLVRVEDTTEHREWLDRVVQKLLENQVACGAIREELGAPGSGMFGKAKTNREYGVTEAPLIANNGDPVADMLYTCNFAFFALNEAAHATNNEVYKEATGRLADFLVRIQARSDKHPDLDGAWMRAFDYNRWDYWASNADHGWGAWSTLTGWIQSWIVATQVLVENKQSFWKLTNGLDVQEHLKDALWMLEE